MKMNVVTLLENVKPGMMDLYVEGTKGWIAEIKKMKPEITFSAFDDNYGSVEYLATVRSFTEIESIINCWKEADEKIHGTEWGEKRGTTINWSKIEVWWQISELTYIAKESDPSSSDMPYFIWENIRVNSKNEKRFMECAAKIREHYQKYGIKRSYGFFRNIIGVQGPYFGIVYPGKDPSEIFQWHRTLPRKFNAELKERLDALYLLADEVTEGSGWALPELSLPKN